MGSAPLPASSPLVGSAPSPMMQAVDDPERQWLANQLRGLLIRDAPAADAQATFKPHGSPAPAVKNAALADVPVAHGSYYGYNFGASGSSIHHELHKHAGKKWFLIVDDCYCSG